MLARLIPLALAMVLAITPMARAICEWSCADGIHGLTSTASAHHGHSTPARSDAVADNQPEHPAAHSPTAGADHPNCDGHASCQAAVSLVPLCCAHADSHAISIATAKIAFEPPAMTAAAFVASDLIVFGLSSAPVNVGARPPVPLSLHTPLRV